MQPENRELQASGFSISIVIPTWNGLDLLRENLPSVLEAVRTYGEKTGGQTEVIVVDDGSSDETTTLLPLEFPQIRLVARDTNGGFAIACNSGFRACRFELVGLLNNDVRLDSEFFLHKTRHFSNPQVFAVTAKVYEWGTTTFASGGRFGSFRKGLWSVYFNYDVSGDATGDWVSDHKLLSLYAIGGFATYCREKLQQVGGFNELLSPFHWEDVDISYRGWKRGWEIHYEPRSIAWHRTSATIQAHYIKRSVDQVSFRNRLLFHWINLHSRGFMARHVGMMLLLFLTRILVLDFGFYRALKEALQKLPEVKRLRAKEKQCSVRSDRQILRQLKSFYSIAPIRVYYNRRDVIESHPDYH